MIDKKILYLAAKMSKDIEILNLSVRSYNAVRRWGIRTVGELYEAYADGELPKVRSLGAKGYQEIEHHLKRFLQCGE